MKQGDVCYFVCGGVCVVCGERELEVLSYHFFGGFSEENCPEKVGGPGRRWVYNSSCEPRRLPAAHAADDGAFGALPILVRPIRWLANTARLLEFPCARLGWGERDLQTAIATQASHAT